MVETSIQRPGGRSIVPIAGTLGYHPARNQRPSGECRLRAWQVAFPGHTLTPVKQDGNRRMNSDNGPWSIQTPPKLKHALDADPTGAALIKAWMDCVQSGDQATMEWCDRHRYALERGIARLPLSSEMSDYYLRHAFKMEPPKIAPILICAMPKAGSTSFCKLLSRTLQRPTTVGHNINSPVQGLDMHFLHLPLSQGQVIHSHLLPSFDVLALIKSLKITPLIVLRNILDALESRVRHESRSVNRLFFRQPKDMTSIIHNYAYEYILFAHCWLQTSTKFGWPIFYYNDMIEDWHETILDAIHAIGIEVNQKHIEFVVEEYQKYVAPSPHEFRITGQEKKEIPEHLRNFIRDQADKFDNPALKTLLDGV